MAVLFLFKQEDVSRRLLLVFFVLNVSLTFVERNGVRIVLMNARRLGLNQKHIILVGYSRAAEEYIDRIVQNPQWGYVIRGILDDHVSAGTEYRGIKVIGRIANLMVILPNSHLDEIAITLGLNEYYRLEEIVTGIFDRVAEAPESAPDLHRLMKYYLPTTQKLVDTYATLDRQTVKGENIENAKREIEDSLDTINEAFERFLDSFFQATAWDVSSDISVMGQMMAQDGLTGGNEFRKAAGQKKAAAAAAAQASDTAGEAGPQAEQPGDVQAQPAQPAPAGYTDGYTEGYTEGYAASGAAVAAAPAAAEEEKN
jgi:hypothetical protein